VLYSKTLTQVVGSTRQRKLILAVPESG